MLRGSYLGFLGVALMAGAIGLNCGGSSSSSGGKTGTDATGGGTGSTGESGPSGSGGGSASGGSSGSGGSGASTSTSGSASTSSSGTGGGASDPCTTAGLTRCAQMKKCAPNVYAAEYGPIDTSAEQVTADALCTSEAALACQPLPGGPDGLNPGVVDPAQCATDLSGACDTYLKNTETTTAACQPKPGTKALTDGCIQGYAQCGAGLACTQVLNPGTITPKTTCCQTPTFNAAGTDCLNNFQCDASKGLYCLCNYSDTYSNKCDITAASTCQAPTLGKAGASCGPDTAHPVNKQCDSGFACGSTTSATPAKCVARLPEGATCKASDTVDGEPCDARLGLSCLPTDASKPTGPTTCQAAYVVPVDAQCGMVQDSNGMHEHVCAAFEAFCSAKTGQCAPLAMKGEACVTGGCYPPYVCGSGGICQAASPPVDPIDCP